MINQILNRIKIIKLFKKYRYVHDYSNLPYVVANFNSVRHHITSTKNDNYGIFFKKIEAQLNKHIYFDNFSGTQLLDVVTETDVYGRNYWTTTWFVYYNVGKEAGNLCWMTWTQNNESI